MTYDDGVLTCKSSELWYALEQSGKKPNTVRVVPHDELLLLGQCTRIRVMSTDGNGYFVRPITGVYDITDVVNPMQAAFGSARTVLICWEVEQP